MAWVLLLASAAAVAGTGIITTVLILSHLENWPGMSWWVLWPRRNTDSDSRRVHRVPGRFSLLFAPLFVGEVALRAASLWPVYSAHYMAVLRKEAGHRR
jgi:hypothetical protein